MNKTIRIVQGGFAGIFLLAIVSAYIRGLKNGVPVWGAVLITICAIAAGAGLCIFYRKLKTANLTEKKSDRIFFIIAGAMLVVQIIFALVLYTAPRSDLSYVDSAARHFSQTWDKGELYQDLPARHLNYFVRYTNNQALLVMLSLIYSACNTLFGEMPYIVPIILNTLGLNLSVVLMYFISKRIFRNTTAPLFCGILATGFSVFYTYTPYYYTDSVSMPFAMGSILLFLKGLDSRKKLNSALQLALSGVLLIAGYKIKGSVIILIPAFILYLIVFTKKINFKMHLKCFAAFLAGCIVMTAASGAFINSFNIADEDELEAIQFPPTHWIMMGLHGRGGFYMDDFWYTINSGDYDQKKQANIEKIKERISDYGIAGMTEHLASKISWTWWDGTYFISYYLKKGDPNPVRSFICHSKIFIFYCSVYQFILLFSILFSFIRGAMQKRPRREILFKIIICGIFFFFVIWETRSRYLVNFTPLFIIATTASIKDISAIMSRKATKKAYKLFTKSNVA